MLPTSVRVVVTKTWFDNDDQFEQTVEVSDPAMLDALNRALSARQRTNLFSFDHGSPRHAIEFMGEHGKRLSIVGLRGGLLEDKGEWFFVGSEPSEMLDRILANVAKKKVEWNEELEALLARG